MDVRQDYSVLLHISDENLYDIIWTHRVCNYLQKAAQDLMLLVMSGRLHSTLVGTQLAGPAAVLVIVGVTAIQNRMVVMKAILHQAQAAAPPIGCHQHHLRALHRLCTNKRQAI